MNQRMFIDGIGAIGPGFADWAGLREILRGDAAWTQTQTQAPALQLLPPAERRRVGMLIKISLASGMQAVEHAGADVTTLQTVFTSSGGDGENCHVLCEALASEDRSISPTRFHNSVHNAASGYWSIATGSMAASTSLCAYDASFAAGLLEAGLIATSSETPCLLIASDDPYGGPLGHARPIADRMGIALLLNPRRTERSLACIELAPGSHTPSACPVADMQGVFSGIPCARALPMLATIARREEAEVELEYLAPLTLRVAVSPCS